MAGSARAADRAAQRRSGGDDPPRGRLPHDLADRVRLRTPAAVDAAAPGVPVRLLPDDPVGRADGGRPPPLRRRGLPPARQQAAARAARHGLLRPVADRRDLSGGRRMRRRPRRSLAVVRRGDAAVRAPGRHPDDLALGRRRAGHLPRGGGLAPVVLQVAGCRRRSRRGEADGGVLRRLAGGARRRRTSHRAADRAAPRPVGRLLRLRRSDVRPPRLAGPAAPRHVVPRPRDGGVRQAARRGLRRTVVRSAQRREHPAVPGLSRRAPGGDDALERSRAWAGSRRESLKILSIFPFKCC